METSVPPPPPPPPGAPVATAAGPVSIDRGARPGQLTFRWRLVVLATWVLVFLAYSGVWKASRELGLSTWWLGPVGAPRPVPVLLAPFVAPVIMIFATLNNARRLPWLGLAASAVGLAIALGDLGRVRRLGIAELAIAGAAAIVSVASLGGRYRRTSGVNV